MDFFIPYQIIMMISEWCKYFVTAKQAKYEFIKDGDVVMVDASEDLSGVNKSIKISGIQDKLVHIRIGHLSYQRQRVL
jgi:hypothetical protein